MSETGGHSPNPKATNIPKGPAPGASTRNPMPHGHAPNGPPADIPKMLAALPRGPAPGATEATEDEPECRFVWDGPKWAVTPRHLGSYIAGYAAGYCSALGLDGTLDLEFVGDIVRKARAEYRLQAEIDQRMVDDYNNQPEGPT